MTFTLTAPARAELIEALGADAVRTDAASLAQYSDPFPIAADESAAPSAVVSPSTVEEVQEVVRIAGRFGAPLWTVSRGKNNGYGGASPRVPGSVVVELSRMNRIIEVNAELGYAVLEPGVTFFDLAEHLAENDIPLWPSVPQLGWGSVVGNGLDRGMGYTAYGEHGSQQCGYEVVLADGSLLRTGMGAMPGNNNWHTYRPGFGVAVDGLFQQSNFGIVVRSGVWLMPRPETFALVDIKAPNWEDISALVDTVRPFSIDGTIRMGAVITNTVMAGVMLKPRVAWFEGTGVMPESGRDAIKAELGIGEWILTFGLYGSEGRVADDIARLRAAFEKIPGATVHPRLYAGSVTVTNPESIPEQARAWASVPGMYAENLMAWRETDTAGSGMHTSFSPVLTLRGTDALATANRIRGTVEKYGIDYVAAFHLGPRYISHVVEIIWDSHEAETAGRIKPLVEELIDTAAAAGQAEYRAHVGFMDRVADTFSYNDHALRRVQERIKDALDPHGILSPGKSGIWPASMRG